MIELYQFELSEYAEKVRLILDYKGLQYRKIEVTPGVGQIEVFKISGQRQVPVLVDAGTVVADSTAIAMYLDRQYPEKPIMPTDARERGLCLMMEEWADSSLGILSRKALYGGLSQNQDLRTSVLPSATPDAIKGIVGSIPKELLDLLGFGVGAGPDEVKSARDILKQNLEALSLLLVDNSYLVGNSPTLADFAVAGLSMYIKFPDGPYLDIPERLKGKGVPGLADDPMYETFFAWRDRLYAEYRRPLSPTASSNPSPTSIEIE